MRKTIAILSLLATSLMSYGASAQPEGAPPAAPPPEGAPPAAAAPEAAPAPAPVPAGEEPKMQAGLNLLPMLLGKGKADNGSYDLKFAYGVGLHFDYAVIPGLTVGIAPQAIFNVKAKDGGDAAKQFDLLARIAYAYTVMPKLAVGAEVLPGYSIIVPKEGSNGKGFLVAFGAFGAYDVTDQVFVNLNVGYQMGLQKADGLKTNTRYLRIALGGGVKF